ncbi:hypothetical protein [Algoriphagus terrigena]|uniref:hypothetical protein n=1 Tax=Algoriphagus terrigena TaxID=344884 RepID=UPI0012FB53EF|nr:hypothetical protein [Algoriphagus terrigena]
MGYISGGILLVCIVMYVFNFQRIGSLVALGTTFLLFATFRHILLLWQDPINSFKSIWVISAAFLLLGTYKGYEKYQNKILFAGIIITCMYFQVCGLAHFRFIDLVSQMVPDYIPYRLFFAYLTGLTLVLASIGILIPYLRKAVALLSALQIFGWFLLLHLYHVIEKGGDEWIGLGESLTFTGICLLLVHYFYAVESKEAPPLVSGEPRLINR